jgi:phage tail-like protein
MPRFAVNSHRQDPYKNFKFRVRFSTSPDPVAGLSKMSPIKKTTEAIEWREADGSSLVRKMPGRTKCEAVTLEAGLTHDRAFLEWAEKVNSPQGDASSSLKDYRREVIIEVLNMQGTKVMSFTLHRAWPAEFQALPEMDANANAVAIQTLKLEYEGFTLEDSEPQET